MRLDTVKLAGASITRRGAGGLVPVHLRDPPAAVGGPADDAGRDQQLATGSGIERQRTEGEWAAPGKVRVVVVLDGREHGDGVFG